EYRKRRDLLIEGIKKLGLSVNPPKATFYLWVKVPKGFTSEEFTLFLLKKSGVVVTPGTGFGEEGEGYVRMSYTLPTQRIEEVIRRWEKIGLAL
ncbi:MAG TPA: aminotransferase class I/II-fold pyridoxal phosphate-dependent enzyme, partial [bacterium]|nr:aminotransferase class I/II-fold pyridoxal phosphate-dependent enzyme [bacterium]HEX67599.1 aminotransferase class I/II-fold pyridoxal phosphate-dependent enzyme [bacterium]